MPQPRLDDANIEFTFTEQEGLIAQILDPVKIAWLQTKYARYWKLKNSTPVPESTELDRSYFIRIAELEGRMNFIQELLDDHKTAIGVMQERTQADPNAASNQTEAALAERAANQVHRIPHS